MDPKDKTKTFEEKVMDGVTAIKDQQKDQGEEIKTIKSQQETLLENYDQLDQKTKQAMEDFTKAKNELNSLSDVANSMKKLKMQLGREQRAAFGDPIQRILANEEHRTRVNLMVRQLTNKDGQFDKAIATLQKALGEDSSPGSTMIDDALMAEMYDTLSTYGIWNTLGVRTIGTKTNKFPVKTARPIAYAVDEGVQIPDDDNKAGTSVSAVATKIAVLLNVSNELLDDSEFDVAADVLNDFMEAVAYRLDFMAFVADGDSTGTAAALDGGQTGIFESGTAAVADATEDTIAELQLQDWMNVLLAVDPAVLSRPARWWMHPFTLVRSLAVQDQMKRPLFQTALEAPAHGAIGSILGYPVTLGDALPNTNTASSKIAAFGDPQGHVVGIRKSFDFARSEHHRFDYDEVSFRGIARAGMKTRRAKAFGILTLGTS